MGEENVEKFEENSNHPGVVEERRVGVVISKQIEERKLKVAQTIEGVGRVGVDWCFWV